MIYYKLVYLVVLKVHNIKVGKIANLLKYHSQQAYIKTSIK